MYELWEVIPGYESYDISNLGNVRNSNGKLLSQPLDKDGYKTVSLCKNAKQKTFRTHRIVASVFIPNECEKETIDHINGIKTDNRVTNLQWMSIRENVQKYHNEIGHALHKERKRRTGLKRGEAKRIPIIQCSQNGEEIKRFCSLMDAERETGIGSGRISLCINGKKKSAGGYLWQKETHKNLVPGMGDWR